MNVFVSVCLREKYISQSKSFKNRRSYHIRCNNIYTIKTCKATFQIFGFHKIKILTVKFSFLPLEVSYSWVRKFTVSDQFICKLSFILATRFAMVVITIFWQGLFIRITFFRMINLNRQIFWEGGGAYFIRNTHKYACISRCLRLK